MSFPLSPSDAAAESVCTRFLVMKPAMTLDTQIMHFIHQIAAELGMILHIDINGELDGEPAHSETHGTSSPNLIFKTLSENGYHVTITAEQATGGSLEALRSEITRLGYFHQS